MHEISEKGRDKIQNSSGGVWNFGDKGSGILQSLKEEVSALSGSLKMSILPIYWT